MSDVIVRLPVRAAVRGRVIQRIVDGDLSPGSPINLANLARELAVSATPLREALIELERDGFVEAYQGRGFSVRSYEVAEVRDIYPMIWTLEMLALRNSPEFSTTRLRELDEINSRLEREIEPLQAARLDTLWHETLLAECPNATLLTLLDALKKRAQRYEYGYLKESGHKLSTQQHTGIVGSLRMNNVARAVELLEENWRLVPQFLLPWLEAQQSLSQALP